MFDFELMKKLRAEGKTTKEAADLLGVGCTTLKRRGWAQLPLNNLSRHQYKKDLNYFKSIDGKDKAYILGFLLTDGSIGKRGAIRFEISERDIEVLHYIRSNISPETPIKYVERTRSRNQYTWTSKTVLVTFKAKNYVEDLRVYGIVPSKTYERQILPNIPEEFMPDLIRGIFDGDGCVCIDRKYPRVYFTGELNLLNELALYLYKKGIISKLCKVFTKPKQYDCVFSFGSQKDTFSFFNYIYKDAPFYLTRKFKKFNYELT